MKTAHSASILKVDLNNSSAEISANQTIRIESHFQQVTLDWRAEEFRPAPPIHLCSFATAAKSPIAKFALSFVRARTVFELSAEPPVPGHAAVAAFQK